MDDEKLIELVRKYEFLYNLQHPKYMDSVKKKLAWKEISDQLSKPAAACKLRWQGLRDAYRRALKKRKGKSGQAAKNIKKWKYEDEMSFVASYLVEKKNLESLELTSDEEGHEIESPNVNNGGNHNEAVDVASSHDSEVQEKDDTMQRKTPQHFFAKKATRVQSSPVQTPCPVLMSRRLYERNIVPQYHDELDRFFLSLSETVKKFSPYEQAVAKSQIFSLVSEMELQQLAPSTFTNTPQYGYTSSPERSSSSNQANAIPLPPSLEP